MKKPLVVLTGPTAVGKTELSLTLAERIGGEIISCDSMQVYKEMDIGSAKATKQERTRVPHHLIDICRFDEDYNVARFQKEALHAAEGIWNRGRIPILTGGTGFYIQSVLYAIDFTENPENEEIRQALEAFAREKGPEALHERLREADPGAAEAIHPNNIKRVIRALEFYQMTGNRISEHNEEERKKTSPYNSAYFVLNLPRPILYQRIDERVDQMLAAGLVTEVEALKAKGARRGMVSMQGLGYKEILDYLDGECSLQEASDRIKQETRHFAKRQLTWFRREKEVLWVNKEEYASSEELLEHLLEVLKEKEIIR